MTAWLNGALLSIPLSAAAWLLLRAIPRRALNAATRYWILWFVLMAALLLPAFFVSWPAPQRPIGSASARAVPRTGHVEAIAAPIRNVPPAIPPEPSTFPLRIQLPNWIPWAWAAVSSILLLRLLLSYFALERLKSRATPIASSLPVRVAASAEIQTALAAGPHRRTILIPQSWLSTLSCDEVEQVLAHEAAHLARHDDWWLLGQRLTEASLPWYPAVLLLSRQIHFEREVACDDFVLRSHGPRPYARCLTRLAELSLPGATLTASALTESPSHLIRRIDMLLCPVRNIATRPLKLSLCISAALLVGALWAAAQSPAWIAISPKTMTPKPAMNAEPVQLVAQAQPPTPAPPPPAKPAATPTPAPTPAMEPVRIAVEVTGSTGYSLTGLTAENFRIYDRGYLQTISAFIEPRISYATATVIDAHEASRIASAVFAITWIAGDESFYFNVHAPTQLPEAAPFARANSSSLYEAIDAAAKALATAKSPRRILWIQTDRGERSFGHSPESLLAAVKAAGAQVHVIRRPDMDADVAGTLDLLAENSNGNVSIVTEALSLGAMTRMQTLYQQQYILEFVPNSPLRPGETAPLKVEVVGVPGPPQISVRHRAQYYASR